MLDWYTPSKPGAVPDEPPSLTIQEPLPPEYLSSRYFLGLTRQTTGDLAVRDGEMRLRIESPNDLVLTQAGMFMPLEAPDDVHAVWSMQWPYLSEQELNQLQAASDAGLLTIDDPILASCTGYISNLSYRALSGHATPEGGNVYAANVEFPVTRLEWQPYAVIPVDSSYGAGSGFGAKDNGQCALRTPTGIDVVDGWFECTNDPIEYLSMPGTRVQQEHGTFVVAFQPFTGWKPGVAGSTPRMLVTGSDALATDVYQLYLQDARLVARLVPHTMPTEINLAELLPMPAGTHYVAAAGWLREQVTNTAGVLYERWRVSLGITGWHAETPSQTVFQEFSGVTAFDPNTRSLSNNDLRIGGPQNAGLNTGLHGRVRPIDNRFYLSTYLTRGMLNDLTTRYLNRHALRDGPS